VSPFDPSILKAPVTQTLGVNHPLVQKAQTGNHIGCPYGAARTHGSRCRRLHPPPPHAATARTGDDIMSDRDQGSGCFGGFGGGARGGLAVSLVPLFDSAVFRGKNSERTDRSVPPAASRWP
jgi:hypothetical protein